MLNGTTTAKAPPVDGPPSAVPARKEQLDPAAEALGRTRLQRIESYAHPVIVDREVTPRRGTVVPVREAVGF